MGHCRLALDGRVLGRCIGGGRSSEAPDMGTGAVGATYSLKRLSCARTHDALPDSDSDDESDVRSVPQVSTPSPERSHPRGEAAPVMTGGQIKTDPKR